MSEQDSPVPKQDVKEQVTEKVKQAKDTVRDAVPVEVREQGERVLSVVAEVPNKVDVFKVISTVALVGILINNRRSFKFTKKIVKNMDRNVVSTQEAIKQLKAAGQTFEFFPGVGLWVD